MFMFMCEPSQSHTHYVQYFAKNKSDWTDNILRPTCAKEGRSSLNAYTHWHTNSYLARCQNMLGLPQSKVEKNMWLGQNRNVMLIFVCIHIFLLVIKGSMKSASNQSQLVGQFELKSLVGGCRTIRTLSHLNTQVVHPTCAVCTRTMKENEQKQEKNVIQKKIRVNWKKTENRLSDKRTKQRKSHPHESLWSTAFGTRTLFFEMVPEKCDKFGFIAQKKNRFASII